MADPGRLLEWFKSLASRTLDLVGDYAGDELFLIEGDSLLLQCFSDKNLDLSHGLQLVHITYLVEKFLAQLHQRKCVFHIVFFTDHAQICVPPNAHEALWPKYLLAREAVQQHLVQKLQTTIPSIQVRRFASYRCGEFEGYLHSVGAYFLMCHDGTAGRYSNSASSNTWPAKIMLRSMIHWFVLHGYNISILNSLDCRDSKVISVILEGSVSRARQLYECAPSAPESSNRALLFSPDLDDYLPDMGSLNLDLDDAIVQKTITVERILTVTKENGIKPTQRELATVIALGMMPGSLTSNPDGFLNACAMLLHTAIMSECNLSERATFLKRSQSGETFLQQYAHTMVNVLISRLWREIITLIPCSCDLGDAIDGSLFLETLRVLKQTGSTHAFSSSTWKRFEALRSVVSDLFEIKTPSIVATEFGGYGEKSIDAPNSQSLRVHKNPNMEKDMSVLPFNNQIIDAHLKPVSVVISKSVDEVISSNMSRIFQELSHWHNHKRLLNTGLIAPLTEWQISRILRRNQFFMTDVRRYAASLTNSVGGSLEPETVFAKSQSEERLKRTKHPHSSLGRKKHDLHEKPSIWDQIAAQQTSKQNEAVNRHFASWKLMVKVFEREYDYSTRYIKVKQYLADLPRDKRAVLEMEVLAYMASSLVLLWREKCNTQQQGLPIPIAARIWNIAQQIAKAKHGVTDEIADCMQNTVKALGLPSIQFPRHEKRKLSFNFAITHTLAMTGVGVPATDFQLMHAGPYMDRSMGSARDSRVHDFEPDKWQREVLDQIDARRSLFVVAPTSAGKTFISFYAMKQILEDDNDGVLVYVAPTKALVNQIAAEVQARFSKSFNNTPGKSVWAIHTRDYRINNPTGCQVLITVPHILQIMLLAPSNARAWSPRIKRIIFDEVHCIGQAEDGVIWEQLLLLAPCPIIALSATVGNPDEFKQWLAMAQEANGLELTMIQHKTRYSDLRKFIYNPPSKFVFNGLSKPPQLGALELDESPSMAFLHPVASLIDRSRGLPDDLTLEPRDCFTLWKAMKKFATDEFPVDELLDPSTALPDLIKKADVIEWEIQLKTILKNWMSHDNSPFETVVQELSIRSTTGPDIQVSGEIQESLEISSVRKSSVRDTTLPLICSLHDQAALPALFFNYDRAKCEEICDHILIQLENSEERWKASSPVWKKKLTKLEEWKKAQAKRAIVKVPTRKRGRRGDDDDEDRVSQAELMRENASRESSRFESFNPEDPVSGFHFADEKKLTPSEFEEYATELRGRDVPERLITALKRGIGVHHAGMNRRYRQVCEILFRKGYLRVVIATGTLALGINMPCKTVVFSGDSVYLTALNFRQAAGRAGRRGFDFLGNVVFQGLSHQKVCRLLSSRLPDLNGYFPITTSLVLRLFILLHESERAPYAVKAINSILSCPRIYLGGPESKHTVLHHLRFSIEYLRRNWLLDKEGVPLNFAGMVSHLYYTENSSFAFHALFSDGYFHRLCENINHSPKETLRVLMLVMSHLFGRQFLRPSVLESWNTKRKSTSLVVLPEIPQEAANILHSHNQKTLSIYSAYVTTFIEQHIHDDDCTLPLTGVKCGGDRLAKDVSASVSFREPTQVTSSFIALSGHRDEWKSISELCKVVRSGVWLEQSVIPHVQVSAENGQAPLNAYLYDFFRHGNLHALAVDNMIRKGDLWFILNDFSLVLATIVTNLENFMKLSPGTDCEMLEIMGSGDAFEDELDDRVLGAAEGPKQSELPTSSKGRQPVVTAATRSAKTKKTEVADSWEDEISDEDEENRAVQSGDNVSEKSQNNSGSSDPLLEMKDAVAVIEGKGLLQVLQAFRMLKEEFDEKFKAIWA
ncbi:DEAD/DEAH box helicase [Aspergillus aurantiobrunneus]